MADGEVVITSDNSGENFSLSVWDINSGMQLKTYKGGNCSAHTFSLLGKQYVVAGQANKPIIYVWNIAKEQIHMKQICPGKVSAVTCSPDGYYCVVSCGENIYIWQVATGHLLAMLSRHFQTVSCLTFTDNGAYFLSGGDDNLVMTWDMAQVLCQTNAEDQSLTPRHTWTDHSLPVTDIYCGCGGLKAHVFTGSLDQTCKMYSLGSGQLLCSFVFDCGITAITTDPSEYNLFVGGHNGCIYQVHLYNPALKDENHVEKDNPLILKGHSKHVTSLSVSMDGSVLISGSSDCTARMWHIPSRQCTRTIAHKGSVTNAQIIPRPTNLNDPLPRTLWPPIQPFKRHLQTSQDRQTDKLDSRPGDIPMVLNECLTQDNRNNDAESDVQHLILEHGSDVQSKDLDRQGLLHEVSKLQTINQDLYHLAVDRLMVEVKHTMEKS